MPEATAVSPPRGGSGLVTGIEVFEGPNLYLPHAAIVASLDIARFARGKPRALQPAELTLLADVLLARCRATAALQLQPSSQSHLRSPHPQSIAATLAFLCLELQRLNTTYADGMCVIGGGPGGRAKGIAYGFENIAMGRAAAVAACDLVDAVLSPGTVGADVAAFVLPDSLKAFLDLARAAPILRSSRKILRSAKARGIPWLHLLESTDLLQLGHGCRRHLLRGSTSDATSQIGHWLTSDKRLNAAFVTQLGFPAPRQIPVTTLKAAIAAAHDIGYPVVVKPRAGFNGRGITVGITRDEDMAAAFALAATLKRGVLVERFMPGDAFRMIVVGGRLASASLFRSASITGDGRSNVAALVAAENARPVRGQVFASGLLPIRLDEVSKGVLASQGLTTKSVPQPGQTVQLRRTANLSTGGKRTDVTALVHPDNRRMAEQIARATAIDITGIDFITTDITRSFRELPCGINEVNTNPGIGYGDPDAGLPDETIRIIDLLFPPGMPATIPIVHVHGGKEADAIAVALAHRLANPERPVGCASGRGLEIDGLTISDLPQRGDAAAGRALLCNPAVACAILAIPGETVRRRGIGTDRADVTILTRDSLFCATLARAITSGPIIVPADLVALLPDAVQQDTARLIAVGDLGSPLALRVWRDAGDGSIRTGDGLLESHPTDAVSDGDPALFAAAAAWALEAGGRN